MAHFHKLLLKQIKHLSSDISLSMIFKQFGIFHEIKNFLISQLRNLILLPNSFMRILEYFEAIGNIFTILFLKLDEAYYLVPCIIDLYAENRFARIFKFFALLEYFLDLEVEVFFEIKILVIFYLMAF